MTGDTRRKLLKTVLVVTGAGLCFCGVLMLLPVSWLRAMAEIFMKPEVLDSVWPDAALYGYLLRACLAAYLWIGIVLLVTASDPARYARLVDVAIGMLFVLAGVCAVAGVTSGLPAIYYLGDAVPSFIVAAMLFALRPRKEKTEEAGAG